jgi:hypothetical protein
MRYTAWLVAITGVYVARSPDRARSGGRAAHPRRTAKKEGAS